MTKTLIQKTKKYLPRILLSFFVASVFLPTAASAMSPTPTTAEPYCFSYKTATGVTVGNNRCHATLAACTADAGGYVVMSKCGLATAVDPASTGWPSITNPIALAKKIGSTVSDAIAESASFLIDQTIGRVLQGIAWLIFTVAGFFLQSMAMIMDYSIAMTIDSQLLGGLAFVNIGWTLIRDFSNMFFIFALLYVAIRTVLGLAGSNTKTWVAHLIIAALLINFSLFFTKVVIDAGNIVAVSFWDKLKVQQGPATINSASAKILQGLDIQTILTKEKNLNSGKKVDPSHSQMAMIYAGGAIFMFIAGYIFLAGALMMVTRTIALILLMVFSPFAFLAYALPGGGGGHGGEWFKKLIKYTFSAPLFIFMLYLNSILIDSVDLFKLSGAKGDTFTAALSGDASSFAIIYNFILLIGFLIASISIANKYAGEAGEGAHKYAKKFIGAGVVGGGAMATGAAGRQLGGRFGKMTAESDKLRKMAESSSRTQRFFANAALKTGEVAKGGTWDIRNAPMGGMGMRQALGSAGIKVADGSKRTFDTHGSALAGVALAGQKVGVKVPDSMTYRGTTKEADVIKIANERFKNNPVARDQYIRDQLGAHYDTPRHKETRDKVARDTVLKDARDTIKTKADEQKKLQEQLKNGAITKDVAETTSKAIAQAIGDAMGKLNSKEIAEMLPLHATNSAFTSNLSKQDLHAIQRQELEGKYAGITMKDSAGNDVKLLDEAAKGVMGGNNEEAKKYLMSAEGQKSLFEVEKYRPTYELGQKTKARITDINLAHDAALAENAKIDAASAARVAEEAAKAAAKRAEESAAFASTIGVAGQSYSKRA